jgi:phosphatidylserine/phosphatidylglycerophosphate/cardiolipin synthase-like enzyme
MLLADHSRAIVGSINLTPGSFDSRRELAIEVYAPNVVSRLKRIAHHDWKHSHPLDLTDAGLMAELKKHDMDGCDELALHRNSKKGKKR